MNWIPVTTVAAVLMIGDSVLMFQISSFPGVEKFSTMALASNASGSADDMLNDHAHKSLGDFDSMEEAQDACKAYAKEYAGSYIQCACEEINLTPKFEDEPIREAGSTR